MAYRGQDGAFHLERSEEEQALTECVFGEGAKHLKRWDEFDANEQASITMSFLRKHPELTPDPKGPIGPKSGLKQKQLDWLLGEIGRIVHEVLPELVKNVVDEMFEIDNCATEEKLRGEFGSAINRLKSVDLKILENKIASAPASNDQRLDAQLESLERRASRQADHLQRIDDRVRRLEGKA
jgi:hypothetical protein